MSRKHEPVVEDVGTNVNIDGKGRRMVNRYMLNREQIKKHCQNMGTQGNFGRGQGPPRKPPHITKKMVVK